MTENARIARLWSGFHRLAEADKELIVKVAEVVKQPGKAYRKRDRKETQDKDFHKEIKLSCG